MLSVLSPAKSLDYESRLPTRKHTQPRMLDQSRELIDVLVDKSPVELSRLMNISGDLAELNASRYAAFHTPFDPGNARPAVLAFAGDVYAGLDAGSFAERDFTEAQKQLRILSGLYGALRPLDLIQPYRLEMGTPLATRHGKNLYQYWGSRITEQLAADLAESPGPGVLVNLASQEYFAAVRPAELNVPVLCPQFLDVTDGDAKVIAFYAKRARGAMAGWLVRHRVRTWKQLREFDRLGYAYDRERSTRDQPVFIRHHGASR